MKKKLEIKQHGKYLAPPAIVSLVLIVVLFVIGNYAYGQIQNQLDVISASQSEIEALEEKVDTLSATQIDSIDPTNRSVIAMPEKNQGILFIAQLRLLASEFDVTIISNKISAPSLFEGEVLRSKVNLAVQDDDLDALIGFFDETALLAPISSIEKIDVGLERDQYSANAEMYVYWSPLPQTIPALTEPTVQLSSSDTEILEKLASLRVPSFTVLNPTAPRDRIDPFQ